MSTPFLQLYDIISPFLISSYYHCILCTGGLPPNPIICLIIRILRLFVKPDLIFLFSLSVSYLSENVAQAVSLQSQAPHPLIST